MEARTSHHSSPETSEPCITMHTAVKMPPQRRAGMQEDPTVRIALTHASSNQMGSHIISNCCVQRSCSEKLYVLRTGRHGGQREQRLSRPSRSPLKKNMEIGSYGGAYTPYVPLSSSGGDISTLTIVLKIQRFRAFRSGSMKRRALLLQAMQRCQPRL